MPEPCSEAIERREKLEGALRGLHQAMLPFVEGLPPGNSEGEETLDSDYASEVKLDGKAVMPQESLLPNTQAIMRGTLEWSATPGGTLIRYKDLKGYVQQRKFRQDEFIQAEICFCAFLDKLKVEAKSLRGKG